MSIPPLRWIVAAVAVVAATHVPRDARGQAAERRIIRRIAIEGLQRESETDILSRLKIRLGDVYDPLKVSAETANIYRMDKFRKVDPPVVEEFPDGVTITIRVEERPRISAVVLVGRHDLSEKYLLRNAPSVATRAGGLLNELQVGQDRETIVEKYRESGYVFADVSSRIEPGANEVKVVFEIREGSKVRIEAIQFEGAKNVSPGKLRSLMETGVKGWFLLSLLRPGYYDPEKLARDLREIEDYYHRIGHFDARAELRELRFNARKDRATIRIAVREGPVYVFEGYQLDGNKVFTTETLLRLTRAQTGKTFSQDALDADMKAIHDHYRNRAYIFARVEPEPRFSREGQRVSYRVNIQEANQISIEEIRVRGNVATQDRVIRRELEFYPGELVDWSKLEESRSNLNRLGLFRNIDYTFEPTGVPDRRNVVVNMEEERFGQLLLQFGVSSDLGFLGSVRLRKSNFDITDLPEWPIDLSELPSDFTGAGQTFILELQPGTDYSRYRLQFIEPYIFDTRNALSLSLAHQTIRFDDYDETRSTFAPRISHAFDFDRDFVASVGARIENVKIDNIELNAPQDVFDAAGYSTVIALNTSLSYDKTLFEYMEGPYDGSSTSLFGEYAGGPLGGDVDLYKGIATSEFYFPLYTYKVGPNSFHHVISLSNRFGIVEPHESGESIPIFERFFLGGLRYGVRGFDYRGIGPHENGQPVGGTAVFNGSLEYGFPIFQKLLRGVAFFDYGNLGEDLERLDWSKIRLAVGGGLKINLPLPGQPLPLAFYLGFPLKKEDEDEERVFLFSLGSPF